MFRGRGDQVGPHARVRVDEAIHSLNLVDCSNAFDAFNALKQTSVLTTNRLSEPALMPVVVKCNGEKLAPVFSQVYYGERRKTDRSSGTQQRGRHGAGVFVLRLLPIMLKRDCNKFKPRGVREISYLHDISISMTDIDPTEHCGGCALSPARAVRVKALPPTPARQPNPPPTPQEVPLLGNVGVRIDGGSGVKVVGAHCRRQQCICDGYFGAP